MTWQRVDLSAAEYAAPSEPPITCGLIYRGTRHTISGPPESAKTLVALILGLEHIRGGHGVFALVDFEMGEHRTRRMLDDLGASPDEIAAVFYVSPDGPPNQEDVDRLAAAGVTLAIIDAAAGAYDASALDDNSRADAERFGRTWIEPLWRAGISTALLDHVTKNADTRGKFAIGSERKLGAVDVHLGIEAVTPITRGGHGVYRVLTHKDRPGHLARPRAAALELTSDPDTHRITWTFNTAAAADEAAGEDSGFRPDYLMDRVREHVGTPWYEPASRSALADAVKGKRWAVLRAIDVLLAEGKLTTNGKKVVPVPGNVPGNDSEEGTFPRSHLHRGTTPGTTFGNDSKDAA